MMWRIHSLLVVHFAGFVWASPAAVFAEKPNIVVILADDLGNADLGYRGSQIRTPNIDELARTGVRLESYYGLPVCTPARAALMTGRYPMRYGLQTLVIFPGHKYGLSMEEKTLPEALKEVGYRTAMVGKWHLGHADKKYWPQNRGFDHFYGNVVGEVDYYTKDRNGVIDWQRNGEFLEEEGYYTELIGDEAVNLIEEHDAGSPLFLYFASLAPHYPFQAPEEDVRAYEGVFEDEQRRVYAAMISNLDKQVGRLVAALESKGMRENTLIFFTTDNGGATSALFATPPRSAEQQEEGDVGVVGKPPASNGPFSGGKGGLREGGVRLPALVNWPQGLSPREVDAPLHHVDVMPTLLSLVGGKENPEKPFDGRDATATIRDGADSPHEDVLINVEVFRGAVRKGPWKLIKKSLLPSRVELFDLSQDPGEQNNLADQEPEVADDLAKRLDRYASEQAMSLWLKAQVDFLGLQQGETALDPGYRLDGGLPSEETALPQED